MTIDLETTAGQGSSLGYRFEHLQGILDFVAHPERLGVCVDTCHLFAAGYSLDRRNGTMKQSSNWIETVGTRPGAGLAPERQQPRMRQPRGPARRDRRRQDGLGALPAPGQRSPVPPSADDSGNAQGN